MFLKTLIVLFIFVVLPASLACYAAEPNTQAEKLYSMAERLEKSQPWTVETIEKITGRIINRRSVSEFASGENPDDRLLSDVEANVDREGNFTSVWLCLPRQGLGISRDQVLQKFGKWTDKSKRQVFDQNSLRNFGYRTLIDYGYKRKNGGWFTFKFDDDKDRQLRILRVISRAKRPGVSSSH